MKTKLNPEYHRIYCDFDNYYKFFPDSSYFSYLMTTTPRTIAQFIKPIGNVESTYDCIKFETPILGHSPENLYFSYFIDEQENSEP